MRDRYYIRFEKVLKPYTRLVNEWQQSQWRLPYHERNHTDEARVKWFLEQHNIVVSKNANGIVKLGFASPEDVTLFALRYS